MVRRTCSEKSGGAPPTFARRYVALAFGFGLILGGPGINPAHAQQTVVSIQQERFLLNGVVTHKGTVAEGLLLNSRMAQAIFDDENSQTVGKSAYPDTGVWDAERNVQEFIAALPAYKAKGLRAFTVGLQGGTPGWTKGNGQPNITTAFRSDGTLKGAWLNRLDRVIWAADRQGMVVIVSLFHFGQDHRLADEAAVIRAVDGMTDWLLPYTNVLLEINNEADILYDHAILRPQRVSELITRVKQRSGGRLKVSTSLQGGSIPPADIISASDFVLLHGNGQDATKIKSMVDQVRGMSAFKSSPKPIVFNEDSTRVPNLDAAVNKRASWGYYDLGSNNYRDGYQSPPVNWKINTSDKQAFFDRVAYFTGGDSSSSPEPSDLRVASLTLINADTNKPIAGFEALEGGELTLNLIDLPTANLNVQANTSPSTVGSVIFSLNSTAKYRVENEAPYTLAGDSYPDYNAWRPGPGTYAIVATPYSSSKGGGTAGEALSLTLTLTDAAAPDTAAPVVSLAYNVETGYGEVKATDQSSIALVEVLLDRVKFASGNSVPFVFSTGMLSAGTYTLEARVTDSAGNVGTASSTVTISPPTTSPPPSSPSDLSVMHFTLINADTNKPVGGYETLTGDVTLKLTELPTRNLNLRANTSPSIVGSVRFGLNGNSYYAMENEAPYALAGDDKGNYASWELSVGSHIVTATPYSSSNGGGSAGTSQALAITIVDGSSAEPKYRVNAGGVKVSSSPEWSLDTRSSPSEYVNAAFSGNDTYETSAVIDLSHSSVPAGTPASLFQSERYDTKSGAEMQWSFPVTPGTYEVRLYFAEVFFTTIGHRLFDVAIEKKLVLSNYDIVADVGAFRGVVKSFIVSSDSSLDINLNRVRENPKISAIEIVQR